jgi:hypothetical protein
LTDFQTPSHFPPERRLAGTRAGDSTRGDQFGFLLGGESRAHAGAKLIYGSQELNRNLNWRVSLPVKLKLFHNA